MRTRTPSGLRRPSGSMKNSARWRGSLPASAPGHTRHRPPTRRATRARGHDRERPASRRRAA
eukprot:4024855-Prymnesium_polylepis.2